MSQWHFSLSWKIFGLNSGSYQLIRRIQELHWLQNLCLTSWSWKTQKVSKNWIYHLKELFSGDEDEGLEGIEDEMDEMQDLMGYNQMDSNEAM